MGSSRKFGKKEDFAIEHLVIDGEEISAYISQNDSLVYLRGNLLPIQASSNSTVPKKVLFSLEGKNSKTKEKYVVRGYFDKLEIKASLQDFPPKIVPRILQVDLKSVPCTVFVEPGKRLCQGVARESSNRLLVMYLDRGNLSILSTKMNEVGSYVGWLTRATQSLEYLIMLQAFPPAKLKGKNGVYCFVSKLYMDKLRLDTPEKSSSAEGGQVTSVVVELVYESPKLLSRQPSARDFI